MKKVWFITGSSRGLGRSLTTAVLAQGDLVVATARDTKNLETLTRDYPEQVLALALDVNEAEQVQQAVAKAIAHFGRIDVLVNNAGFGIIGAAEAYTEEQVRSQLETNLYAPIAITRAVLPHMRKQGSGRILQISSVGGRVGNAGLTMYQAAKFGLGGFSEALAREVAPLGIFVTSVEPGGFRTDWAGASMSYATPIAGYEESVDQRAAFIKDGNFVPMGDPDKAAQAMIRLTESPEPPIHLLLGSEAVGMVQASLKERQAELDQWSSLSKSTDHDEAVDFLSTTFGKLLVKPEEEA